MLNLKLGTTLTICVLRVIASIFDATINRVSAAIDPLGCSPMTNTRLRALGYEPIRAHGAVPNDNSDDTAAIQSAIDAANKLRRVVYVHPGEYLISSTLSFRMDVQDTHGNTGGPRRYGQQLLGSYCGNERPTIRLKDGSAPTTNEQTVSGEPLAMIAMWRPRNVASPPDDSDSSRDWKQVVRNLHLILGKNPGAVGIRHLGAEGSAVQEVSIDARNGFAGLYLIPSSGGYTYDVEITGGKYGVYAYFARGGSTLITGITLKDQDNTPIVFRHYGPLVLVGFDITHNNGQIVSGLTGKEGSFKVPGILLQKGDAGGHIALIDGKIDITGNASSVIDNHSRSVYMKNVFVRGENVIIKNSSGGNLTTSNQNVWSRIDEYSSPTTDYFSEYHEEGKLINGAKHDKTYFNGSVYPTEIDTMVNAQADPPADILSRHLYETALCNVEADGVEFVTDFGADPDTPDDDTAGIQAAIDAAHASGINRVFLPSGTPESSGEIKHKYRISDTITLQENTHLCGVTNYSTVLNAEGWNPNKDRPVITTPNSVSARTVLADVQVELPGVGGSEANGWDPHVYAVHWKSGRNSVTRDIWNWVMGNAGDGRRIKITDNGGGRWYGIIQTGGELPGKKNNRSYFDSSGNLKMSPSSAQMYIKGTTEPLTFYSYHMQHETPPYGAMGWIVNAMNITMYGIKHESSAGVSGIEDIIRDNPPNVVPSWLFIRGSNNIALVGYEGHGEHAKGRGFIEVEDSSDITIVNMGHRNNIWTLIDKSLWYFVKNKNGDWVTAEGFLALYKSD